MNSLNVTEESLGTKYFSFFEFQLKFQTSVRALCNLQSPYRIPGLLLIALNFFIVWWANFVIPQVSSENC